MIVNFLTRFSVITATVAALGWICPPASSASVGFTSQINQSNIQLLAQTAPNRGDKKVPAPALLLGLVALGAGILRKRKTEADEVEE